MHTLKHGLNETIVASTKCTTQLGLTESKGGRVVVLTKEVGFEGRLKGGEGGFQTERKRESVPGRGGKDREGAGSKGTEFGAWDGETEGVRGRAEGAWRGVWLERVGEVGWDRVVERL